MLTGPVDDATLRALYRRCAAFAFPSLYEGFGLPVLEALRCGAAVVAGATPRSPRSRATPRFWSTPPTPPRSPPASSPFLAMNCVPGRCDGKARRAAGFTWARRRGATLKRPLESLAEVPRPAGHIESVRPALREPCATLPASPSSSPLPPTASGVAKYAEALIEALGEHHAIDLFHDAARVPLRAVPIGRGRLLRSSGVHAGRSGPALPCASSTRWATRRRTCSSTRRLLKRPGVVVLHDPSLVFFHYERAVRLGRRPRKLPARAQGHAPRPRRRLGTAAGAMERRRPAAMARALVDAGLDMNRRSSGWPARVVVHSRERSGGSGRSAPPSRSSCRSGPTRSARPIATPRPARVSGSPAEALVVASFGIVHPVEAQRRGHRRVRGARPIGPAAPSSSSSVRRPTTA